MRDLAIKWLKVKLKSLNTILKTILENDTNLKSTSKCNKMFLKFDGFLN